jgi:hypothetical protein
MGCYLFNNDQVYFSANGQSGRVPLGEFAASALVQDKSAHILIVEPEGPAYFGQVKRIRMMFARRAIRTCVPYAQALHALLTAKKLLTPGEDLIMVDDLGDRFILTAFAGERALLTRVIFAQSPEKVIEELRRTQKSFPEKAGPLPGKVFCRIVANNPAVIEALEESVRTKAVYLEETLPVFEVLGKIRFSAQLVSPEEAQAEKKRVFRRLNFLAGAAAVCIALAGIGIRFYVQGKAAIARERRLVLVHEESTLEAQLLDLAAGTCPARLAALPQADLAGVLKNFLDQLPPGARLEDADFERAADMRWSFAGRISFPGQTVVPWEDDLVSGQYLQIQGRPGIRWQAPLTEGAGEIGGKP